MKGDKHYMGRPWGPYAAAVAVTAGMLAGCGSASAPPPAKSTAPVSASAKPVHLVPVKLGLAVNILAFAPLQVAEAKGFFAQHGLDVQIVNLTGGTTSAETLYSGGVQFAASAASDVIHADQTGLNLVAIANILDANDVELTISKRLAEQDHITPDQPLKQRLAPLQGQLFGVTSIGSISQIYTQMLFKSVGLNANSLRFIAIGSAPALNAALKGGEIAGYLLGPPSGEIAQQGGYGEVIVPVAGAPIFGKQAFSDIFTTHQYASVHPEVVRAMAASIAEANRFIIDHPDQAAQIVSKTFKVPLPLLVEGLKEEPFVADARFTQAGWDAAEKVLLEGGLLHGTLPSTRSGVMWTNQYLPNPSGQSSGP